MNWATKTIFALVPCASLLLACAPVSTPGGAPTTNSGAPAAPKVLTIGLLTKVATIDGYTGEGGTRGGADMLPLLNNGLTVIDPSGVVQPQLAVEVPSIEKGTWQIFPDGRMSMTWKLRQGAKWHDGAPFTSDDMMFTVQLKKDPDLGHAFIPIYKLIDSVSNPDPSTFIVNWKSIYVKADQTDFMYPNHKAYLEDLYKTDKIAFINSAKYRNEFLGTGPFKLTSWDAGYQMDLSRFDDYWKGRPLLDRIVIKVIADTTAAVATILAGGYDVIFPTAVSAEGAAEVQRRWEGTGNIVHIDPVDTLDYIEPMIRPEYAKPLNGMPQLLVRQAMMHAIDRKALSEVVTLGMGPVADNHWPPYDALYPQLESASVKYPYDPGKALQLLAQAGWTKGPDGVLIHTSGERFDFDMIVNEKLIAKTGTIIADDWKKVGINTTSNPIPPTLSTDRGYQATRTGAYATYSFGDWSSDRLNGRELASEANKFSGRNRVGWQNARSDAVLDQLLQTVDPAKRVPLFREQIQLYTSDAALMPLYWEVRTVLQLKAVKADIRPAGSWWNPSSWDKATS